jgi:hypothetical protein
MNPRISQRWAAGFKTDMQGPLSLPLAMEVVKSRSTLRDGLINVETAFACKSSHPKPRLPESDWRLKVQDAHTKAQCRSDRRR